MSRLLGFRSLGRVKVLELCNSEGVGDERSAAPPLKRRELQVRLAKGVAGTRSGSSALPWCGAENATHYIWSE